MVRALLDRGGSPALLDAEGHTPLHLATATPNAKVRGRGGAQRPTALETLPFCFVSYNTVVLLRLLQRHRSALSLTTLLIYLHCLLNRRPSASSRTTLSLVLLSPLIPRALPFLTPSDACPQIMKMLLEDMPRVIIDAQDSEGMSAAHWAAFHNHHKQLDVLMAAVRLPPPCRWLPLSPFLLVPPSPPSTPNSSL